MDVDSWAVSQTGHCSTYDLKKQLTSNNNNKKGILIYIIILLRRRCLSFLVFFSFLFIVQWFKCEKENSNFKFLPLWKCVWVFFPPSISPEMDWATDRLALVVRSFVRSFQVVKFDRTDSIYRCWGCLLGLFSIEEEMIFNDVWFRFWSSGEC